MDDPVDPEAWFFKGDQLPTAEERLTYYLAGLKMSRVFCPYAWRGIGNARQDLGDKSGAERAYERAADAAIAASEGGVGEKEYPPESEEERQYRDAAPGSVEDSEKSEEMNDEDELTIGKCPKCGLDLAGEDIEDVEFRGFHHRHTVYVCRKCNTIIGFSATRGN